MKLEFKVRWSFPFKSGKIAPADKFTSIFRFRRLVLLVLLLSSCAPLLEDIGVVETRVPSYFSPELEFQKILLSTERIEAVATFESAGLYWSPAVAGDNEICLVRYRAKGAVSWRRGLPLWFDKRNRQCRGSLVHLRSGTRYEIEIATARTGEFATTEVETWREDFPIGETIVVSGMSNEPLVIEKSGTPEGYLLVTGLPGRSAGIDVQGKADRAVEIKGSYVILRGLTVRNARRHLIVLGDDVHDVVIEDNDLSAWGGLHVDGWGVNMDSAIYSKGKKKSVKRIVVQRNRIHHPRSNSNAWDEYRRSFRSRHPRGPQAITFWNTGGNHVIRYNDIFSDSAHKFNDCIGAGTNFSDVGFPYRDTDIYGNRISHCWDDAIEAEGGNMNVRIWNNFMDLSYVMIGLAPTETGPVYVWRNIAYRSRRTAERNFARSGRGYFLKIQGKYIKRKKRKFGGGGIYVFNNTLLQCGSKGWGVKAGPSDLKGGRISNLITRNNIFSVPKSRRPSIADNRKTPTNDYDFDLYNGRIVAADGNEKSGIRGLPTYESGEGCGSFALSPGSKGHDAGVIIPNFTDDYRGRAPDMGAQEIGLPRILFGVDAYGDNGPDTAS